MKINTGDIPKLMDDHVIRWNFSSKARNRYEHITKNSAMGIVFKAKKEQKRVGPEEEKILLDSGEPIMVMAYMRIAKLGNWAAAEPILAKDKDTALWYAFENGEPFPEAEPALASNFRSAFDYATEILESRFIAGEPAIKTQPQIWQGYLEMFPEAAEASVEEPAAPKRRPRVKKEN